MACVKTKTRSVFFPMWICDAYQDKPTASHELTSRKTSSAWPQLSPQVCFHQKFSFCLERATTLFDNPHPYCDCLPDQRVHTQINWFIIWLSTPWRAAAATAASFLCKVSELLCLQRLWAQQCFSLYNPVKQGRYFKVVIITHIGVFENH